jgi:hypothetical protein
MLFYHIEWGSQPHYKEFNSNVAFTKENENEKKKNLQGFLYHSNIFVML